MGLEEAAGPCAGRWWHWMPFWDGGVLKEPQGGQISDLGPRGVTVALSTSSLLAGLALTSKILVWWGTHSLAPTA